MNLNERVWVDLNRPQPNTDGGGQPFIVAFLTTHGSLTDLERMGIEMADGVLVPTWTDDGPEDAPNNIIGQGQGHVRRVV